jgi:hypothetical protein
LIRGRWVEMTEILRYVSLDVGGRPAVLLDLNDMTNFAIVRESFVVVFGQGGKQAVMSPADRRYGGERQHGEITPNGQLTWSALVMGASADACIATVESMLAQLEANPRELLLEWRPDGTSQSSLFEVRGTGSWECKYQWVQFAGAQSMVFNVSIPVAPLAHGLPMDILDLFAVDTRSDYSYDSGASANEEVAGGELKAAANVSTEQRAIHTARGYQYADNQQTVKGTPGATITGWKNGVVLKRIAATTYIEVYVDDEGTNSRLRVDEIIAGVRTNLSTTNLAARVKAATAHWVRGRIEGSIVRAEYFTSAPTPMGARTTNFSVTLEGSGETTFGAGVKGAPGRVWIPETVGAAIDEYSVEPYTYAYQTTVPVVFRFAGSIPGDAPALADVMVTTSGGAAPPIWALLGWTAKPAVGLAQPPFGVIEAESAGNLSGWSSIANAGARGGNMLKDAAALSSDVYTASWAVDPSLVARDAFTTEIAVEVWARVMLAATIVTPSLTLSVRPEDGLSYGAARYTDEWGSAGKLLAAPASGTEKWRMVRLGTLHTLVDPLRPRKWLLWLTGSVGAGTSGEWGIDYLVLVPSQSRACSPSSKPNDSGFPRFIASTAETSKTVKADLSALVAKPPAFGHPDHGLGGELIEFPPGESELLVKLSSLVPDDPTVDATTEQLAHSATVHAAVTPRWYLTRSGS